MMTLIIMIAVGVGVAALVGGIAVALRSNAEGSMAEDRLSTLTAPRGGLVATRRRRIDQHCSPVRLKIPSHLQMRFSRDWATSLT